MAATTTGRRAATRTTVARPAATPADDPARHLATARAVVQRELREGEQALRRIDREAAKLQAQVYGLEARGRQAEADKLWPRYLRTISGGTAMSQRLQVLRQPEEVERRARELARRAGDRARLDELKAQQLELAAAEAAAEAEEEAAAGA